MILNEILRSGHCTTVMNLSALHTTHPRLYLMVIFWSRMVFVIFLLLIMELSQAQGKLHVFNIYLNILLLSVYLEISITFIPIP